MDPSSEKGTDCADMEETVDDTGRNEGICEGPSSASSIPQQEELVTANPIPPDSNTVPLQDEENVKMPIIVRITSPIKKAVDTGNLNREESHKSLESVERVDQQETASLPYSIVTKHLEDYVCQPSTSGLQPVSVQTEPSLPLECSGCKRKITNIEEHMRCDELTVNHYLMCDVCQLVFKRRGGLEKHLLIHKAPCSYCGKKILNVSDLKEHELNCSINPHYGLFQPSSSAIREESNKSNDHTDCTEVHESSSEAKSDFKFICDACSYGFPTEKALTEHKFLTCPLYTPKKSLMISETEEEYNQEIETEKILEDSTRSYEGKYVCRECGSLFQTENALAAHKILICTTNSKKEKSPRAKASEKLFSCENCLNLYTRRFSLNVHRKKSRCTSCPREFTCKTMLRSHEVTCHKPQSKPIIQCETCQITFVRKDDMLRHTKKSHCRKCQLEFTCSTKFCYHEVACKVSDDTPLQCEICKETFLSQDLLMDHKKPPPPCYLCTAEFGCKKEFESHAPNCTGAEFACEECNLRYSSRWILTMHRQVCYCNSCGTEFSCSTQLQNHVLNCFNPGAKSE